MVRDKTDSIVFMDGSVNTKEEFRNTMKRSDIRLFVAMDHDKLSGFGYLTHIENCTARAHFCIFSEYWGPCAIEIGKKLVDYAIAATGLKMFIGMIPKKNERAIKFAIQCGATYIGEFPYGSIDEFGESHPTAVLYYVR